MPLPIEIESEDLLRQALERLKSRLEAPELDRSEGAVLDRWYRAVGLGSLAPQRGQHLSPVFNLGEGKLARADLDTNRLVPIEPSPVGAPVNQPLPLWAMPAEPVSPDYTPGFSYAGAPEGEQAARAAFRATDEGKRAEQGAMQAIIDNALKERALQSSMQLPTVAAKAPFDPEKAKVVPLPGAPGQAYIEGPKGWNLRSTTPEQKARTEPTPSERRAILNDYFSAKEDLSGLSPFSPNYTNEVQTLGERLKRFESEFPWLKTTNAAPAGKLRVLSVTRE